LKQKNIIAIWKARKVLKLHYQSARSVTAGKFDKCLYFL
jgi:hypothetical protein